MEEEDSESLIVPLPSWMKEGLEKKAFSLHMPDSELARRLLFRYLTQIDALKLGKGFYDLADPTSLVRLVNGILVQAIDDGADQVFIGVAEGEERLTLRFRIGEEWKIPETIRGDDCFLTTAELGKHLKPWILIRLAEMACGTFDRLNPHEDLKHLRKGEAAIGHAGQGYKVGLLIAKQPGWGDTATLTIISEGILKEETKAPRRKPFRIPWKGVGQAKLESAPDQRAREQRDKRSDADNDAEVEVPLSSWIKEALDRQARSLYMPDRELARRLVLNYLWQNAWQSIPQTFYDIAEPMTPIVRMANALLVKAIDASASRVFLCTDEVSNSLVIRCRVGEKTQMLDGFDKLGAYLKVGLFRRLTEMAFPAVDVPMRIMFDPLNPQVSLEKPLKGEFTIQHNSQGYRVGFERELQEEWGDTITLAIVNEGAAEMHGHS